MIVADVAFGSGHFNLAQGIVGTATGIGASLSTALGGYVSDKFGNATAFIGLSGVAATGLLLILFVMPETRRTGIIVLKRWPAERIQPAKVGGEEDRNQASMLRRRWRLRSTI